MGFSLRYFVIFAVLFSILSPFSGSWAVEIKTGYGWSVNPDESEAVKEAVKMMNKTLNKPDLVLLLVESSYERDDLIAKDLYTLTNGPAIFGLEGSYAVFSNDGVHVGEKGSLAVLGIKAPSWSIGASVKDMSEAKTPMQIKEMTIDAVKDAVKKAGRTLEDEPALVLVAPTKLKEESILNAIEYIFGKNVRISGGTPGGAVTFANDRAVENGFAVTVIYTNSKIGAGFHAGIAVEKDKSGIITAMGDSPRVIKEINNRPAFEVYREWADGGLDDVNAAENTSIWSRSYALVRVYNLADNEMGTKVVVPIKVNSDLSMVTGADISEGENLYFATTTRQAYVKRAGTIVQQAMVEGKIKYSELAGGIHFYCRGAAFSQFGRNKENLQALVEETNTKIKDKPYIGTFTAGEQGNIKGYGIFMGNLTSSMAVFGK